MEISLVTQEVFHTLLVFVRLGGFVMIAPGLGSAMIPMRVRLYLALAFSFAIHFLVKTQLPALPETLTELALLVGFELVIGIALGALVNIITTALNIAGTLIAYQMGMGVAQIANPALGEVSGIFAAFLTLVGVVLIFSSGSDALLIRAVVNTYYLFPPGAQPSGFMLSDTVKSSAMLVASTFALGVQIATPFIIFGFAFYAGVGVLARLIPQIQVFFLSLPLSILLGLGLFAMLIAPVMNTYLAHFRQSIQPFLQ